MTCKRWVESGHETKGGAGIHYRMFIYSAELSCYVKNTVTAVSETVMSGEWHIIIQYSVLCMYFQPIYM